MKNRLFFVPPFVIIITLFIVGTFCDLNISSAICNVNNGLSRFFAGFADVPLIFALAFIGGSLIKLAVIRYKKAQQRIIISIFVLIIAALSVFLGGYFFTDYDAYQLSSKFIIIIGLAVAIPGFIAGFFLHKYVDNPQIVKLYAFFVITVVITFAFSFGIKYCVSRVRYSFLLQTSLDYYRPWYNLNLPQEVIDAFKSMNKDAIRSFPSGHSNCAMALPFILMYLPHLNKRFAKHQTLLFYIGVLYFFFIAFTRIYTGAHFLTDTMMSGFMALSIYFIANEIYMRKLNNEEQIYA